VWKKREFSTGFATGEAAGEQEERFIAQKRRDGTTVLTSAGRRISDKVGVSSVAAAETREDRFFSAQADAFAGAKA